ncbi:hypothetical protein DM02DRAFT_663778 [Periconia macrospinosa]|uniref:Uncharacterized protein n=1 Tax=Periconia macrospinosa TaxID=97972 RepID=A0A2V1D0Q9_9PLEO|nr:hypothetical protein DM02DRAFT_663778 [Periconia macrospinosa]
MTRTSTYLTRFFTLFICLIIPLYFAFRGPTSFSNIASLLSTLSQHNITFTSSLPTSPSSISKAPAKISNEPTPPIGTFKAKQQTQYSSLPDGLAHCINSFEQYPSVASQIIQRKHTRFSKQTPSQKALSHQLNYPSHFSKARQGIEKNTQLSRLIAQIGRETYHTGPHSLDYDGDAEYGVVDEAFGHLSRDWSTQGAEERNAVFKTVTPTRATTT